MKLARIIPLLLLMAAGWVSWRVFFAPSQDAEEEEEITTEVAVQTGHLAQVTLHRYVSAYGVVEPEPAANGQPGAGARLTPPSPGLVAEVTCTEGQSVTAGQVLVRLDSRAPDIQIEGAREQLRFAQEQYERQRKLLSADGTSQKVLLEAEQARNAASNQLAAAQTQRALLELQAPFPGIITRVLARPGQAVDLTTAVVEMIDPARLIVTTQVPLSDLPGLKPGQPVQFLLTTNALPTQGKVRFVSPEMDPATGSTLVRVSLPPNSGLRAGQYVRLRIVSEVRPDRLTAPSDSVIRTEEGYTFIALVEDGQATRTPVTPGLRDGPWIEIEGEGLKPGDTVVTVGAYGLPEKTRIRVLGD